MRSPQFIRDCNLRDSRSDRGGSYDVGRRLLKAVITVLAMLLSTALVAFGGFLCIWGGFIALRVTEDYKDSPDSTYLMIGISMLAIGLVFVAAGLYMATNAFLAKSK
jgi:hypothetical protein